MRQSRCLRQESGEFQHAVVNTIVTLMLDGVDVGTLGVDVVHLKVIRIMLVRLVVIVLVITFNPKTI